MGRVINFIKALFLPCALLFFIFNFNKNPPIVLHVLWLASGFTLAYVISNIIHEMSHYFFFRLYGLKVTEISFGILRVSFRENKTRFIPAFHRPFKVFCSCLGLDTISRYKRAVCLLSGGLVNLILAVPASIILILVSEPRHKLLFGILSAAFLLNAVLNAAIPVSGDRELLRLVNQPKK